MEEVAIQWRVIKLSSDAGGGVIVSTLNVNPADNKVISQSLSHITKLDGAVSKLLRCGWEPVHFDGCTWILKKRY
jgi:hypothetical protein